MKTIAVLLFALLSISILNACTPVRNLIPVNRSTSTPVEDNPPAATLEIGDFRQMAGLGTFCWNTKTGSGESVDMCVDKIGIPTVQIPIVVSSPVTASLRFSVTDSPQQMSASIFAATSDNELDTEAGDYRWWSYSGGTNLELMPQSEQDIHLELEPGLYVFYVFAVWQGKGDASYGFLVEVK